MSTSTIHCAGFNVQKRSVTDLEGLSRVRILPARNVQDPTSLCKSTLFPFHPSRQINPAFARTCTILRHSSNTLVATDADPNAIFRNADQEPYPDWHF